MPAAASIFGIFQALAVQCAAFQAALLLASGLHKLLRRHRSRAVVHEFAGVPRYLAPFAVGAAAAAELLAGLLLLTQPLRAVGGAVAALIWGVYLWLILRAIAQGRRDVDCGCTFGVVRHPLGPYQVARNGILTGMALLVTAISATAAAGPVAATQAVAAFALLALYGALDQVMALQPLRPGESS